jgi:hypothetical protein
MKQSARKTRRREQLEEDGWVRRTTYDEPRLSELVESYRELGLEVRLEEPDAGELEECNACFKGSGGKLKTIYTREKVGKAFKGAGKKKGGKPESLPL